VVLYVIFSIVLAATLFPVLSARFNLTNRLETKSITERTAQIGQSWNMIKRHSILGVGPGAYTLASFRQNPLLPVWENQPVHNIYLLILAENGVVLLLVFLFIIHYLLFIIWQKNRLFFPIIITLLVAGLFDHWLVSMWTGMALAAIVVGLGHGDRQWTTSEKAIIDKDGGRAYP
jgi:O-antigen ligase